MVRLQERFWELGFETARHIFFLADGFAYRYKHAKSTAKRFALLSRGINFSLQSLSLLSLSLSLFYHFLSLSDHFISPSLLLSPTLNHPPPAI